MDRSELGHTQGSPLGGTEGSTVMGIGLGVVLLLLGLIFAFGVIDLPSSIDDVVATNTLGWILIIVGALAIVLALVMNSQRTRSTRVVEERRVDPPV
jgi:fumarate reductase subunit D